MCWLLRGALGPIAHAFVTRTGEMNMKKLMLAALGEATPERLRPHVFAMGEILAGTGFVVAPVIAGPLYEIQPELPLLLAAGMILPLAMVIWARGKRDVGT